MTAKDKQAAELFRRVSDRLRKGPYAHLTPKAGEIVACFLVCLEELQKMRQDGQA